MPFLGLQLQLTTYGKRQQHFAPWHMTVMMMVEITMITAKTMATSKDDDDGCDVFLWQSLQSVVISSSSFIQLFVKIVQQIRLSSNQPTKYDMMWPCGTKKMVWVSLMVPRYGCQLQLTTDACAK